MNRFFLILIITALSLLSPATTRALTPQYQRADSIKVVTLLAKAAKQPAGTNFMIYFARQLQGIPYVAHTLEVNPTERLVVNLRQLDCTTYVENVCALTLCMQQKQYTFDNFCRNLQTLRYRDGRIDGYASRLHYFTQWIEDNTRLGIVKETQSDRAPFNATQTIDVYYMSKNPNSYKMLRGQDSLIKVIAQQEKEINGRQYRYITKTAIYNNKVTRRTIADGDIIAILTRIPGLDTSHIGIAVWHSDGLHLLNASQIHKKVVEEPMTLRKYMSKHPKQTGIRIIKMKSKK